MAAPEAQAEIRRMVKRLLAEAHRLYLRSESGIDLLPLSARPGIYAARHIYDAIGGAVTRAGYDSVNQRARSTGRQKIGLIGLSVLRTGLGLVMPRSAVLYAQPLPEVAFLVDAAAHPRAAAGWSERVLDTLAELEMKKRGLEA